jgi:hypothetical protein
VDQCSPDREEGQRAHALFQRAGRGCGSNVGDILTGEIAYAYAQGEDNCLFSGDGTSTYGGMTGLRKIFNDGVGALAGSVDAASGHDTMAEIDATDLASVQGKLPQYVYTRGNPTWYCSQTMWANVFERLIGASGGVTKDQASGRTVREYNGYPVEITPAMLAPADPHHRCFRCRHDPVRRSQYVGLDGRPPRHDDLSLDRIQIRRGPDRHQGHRAFRHQLSQPRRQHECGLHRRVDGRISRATLTGRRRVRRSRTSGCLREKERSVPWFPPQNRHRHHPDLQDQRRHRHRRDDRHQGLGLCHIGIVASTADVVSNTLAC